MSWLKEKISHFRGRKTNVADAALPEAKTSAAPRFIPYLELRYFPLARRMIEGYLAGHNWDVEVWCQLAKLCWLKGDAAAAGDALKRALAAIALHGSDQLPVLSLLREMDTTTLEQVAAIVKAEKSVAGQFEALISSGMDQREHESGGTAEQALAVAKEAFATGTATRKTYLLLSRLSTEHGDGTSAVQYLKQGIDAFPTDVTLYHQLARVLEKNGAESEAVSILELAIEKAPAPELAHYQLGKLHTAAKQYDDAASEYYYALTINPLFAEAQARLADVALLQNKFEAAAEGYCSALTLGCATRWAMIAAVKLQGRDRPLDAVKIYRKLLECDPLSVDALSNLGIALRQLGETAEARAYLDAALRVDPTHVGARHNSAIVLGDLGHEDKAIEELSELLVLNPNDEGTIFARAVLLLGKTEFAAGWEGYDLRRHREDCCRPFTFPDWDGSACRGKTLLIYGEQGIGDEIMFASCFSDVLARVDNVIIECDPRLVPLFARSFAQAKIKGRVSLEDVEWLRDIGSIDLQCASGSLPRLFRRSIEAFPAHAGYLRADEAKITKWRERLAQLPGKIKVGLSWRGGLDRTRRNLRSLDLTQLAPLFRLSDVTFVNLQYGDVAAECDAASASLGKSIVQFPDAIADYDETAALVCALDLVVSVQTAIVHLTGALGKTALVMLPFSPEWRYMRTGDRMLWYPSVKLFRQEKPKEWEPVITKIAQELAMFTDARKI